MSSPRSLPPDFLSGVREVIGASRVLTDVDQTCSYATDWTGRFNGETPAVLLPACAEEIAGIVALCREHGIALSIQGGNTGLVGGGVPLAGEVLLSTRRLTQGIEVDKTTRSAIVGSSTTVAQLNDAALLTGLTYGVDLASGESATIGGTIATNAGGTRVIRYGDTRDQLIGLEAVLGSGGLICHLDSPERDNTGYDLTRLLCGSEGTLGVITRARVRLATVEPRRMTALLAFDSLHESISAAALLRGELDSIAALELLLETGVELVCKSFNLPMPFPERHEAYLLVESQGSEDLLMPLSAVLESVKGLSASAIADEASRRERLWSYRELHSLAINALGPPHKLDVSIPLDRYEMFLEGVRNVVSRRSHDARIWIFGHVGDGGVHLNVTGLESDDLAIDDTIVEIVADFHGSISAEHGIGTTKRRWLSYSRSDSEIAAFRAIKQALDPDGVLNPNVLLP